MLKFTSWSLVYLQIVTYLQYEILLCYIVLWFFIVWKYVATGDIAYLFLFKVGACF